MSFPFTSSSSPAAAALLPALARGARLVLVYAAVVSACASVHVACVHHYYRHCQRSWLHMLLYQDAVWCRSVRYVGNFADAAFWLSTSQAVQGLRSALPWIQTVQSTMMGHAGGWHQHQYHQYHHGAAAMRGGILA
jgi:hypothetical protein